MTETIQDNIIDFVSRQMDTTRHIGVTWFGGEPLQGFGVINRLSRTFLRLAAEHRATYGADIITNGVLLTRPIAKKLVSLGVEAAQITLDGVRESHDARRPFLGTKRSSFDIIFKNILNTWDVLGITIRMNLDENNGSGATELIDYLAEHELQGKVSLSFAPVHSEGKACRDRNDGCKTSLFGLVSFSKLQTELHKYALEKGFPFDSLPVSRAHACCADKSHSYVIEPEGSLQKCWQTVSDPQEKIGHVAKGTPMSPNLLKWLNYDPFMLAKCKSCKVLPLCMGWCPHKIMADPSPASCNYIKHNIVDQLKLFYITETRPNPVTTPVSQDSRI